MYAGRRASPRRVLATSLLDTLPDCSASSRTSTVSPLRGHCIEPHCPQLIRTDMKKLLMIPMLLVAIACPKDKKAADTVPPVPLDTSPANLKDLPSALPPEDPDTHKVQV